MSRPFFPLKGLLLVAVLAAVLSGCTVGLPPSGVTETGVTLNGYVTATTGGAVTYWFEFNDRARGQRTISLAAKEGRRVSEPVDGLSPSTSYRWRLCSQQPQQRPDDWECSAPQAVRTADAPICGQPLTENLTLDRDVTCSGPVGLRIGADGLTVDLNGHTVWIYDPRRRQEGLEKFAVVDNGGHHGTTIKNGSLRYCCGLDPHAAAAGTAVALSGSDNLLQELDATGGLDISGDHNLILESRTIDATEGGGFTHPALNVTGDHNTVLRVSTILDDGAHAIAISGSRNRLIDSSTLTDQGGGALIGGDHNVARNVDFRGFLDEALLLTGTRDRILDSRINGSSSVHAVIVRGATESTVRGTTIATRTRGSGVEIEGSVGTRLLANTIASTIPGTQVPPFFDALHVAADSSNTLLRLNTVTGASDDGIDTDSATTTFDRNRANNNGDLGIEAVPGVIDLGGNRATGNGNPLQCVNVFCTTG